MKLRVLAFAFALAGLAAFLTRGAGPEQPPRRAPATPPTIGAGSESPEPLPEETFPARDPFRYSDEPPPTVGPPRGAGPDRAAPTPPPVRLVGLVWQRGRLRAALGTSTGVLLAGAGDEVNGYLVLDVDAESGVRLRGPAGEEIHLPAPP